MDDPATFWDQEASSFDREPDHGLRDRVQREAWNALLAGLMPDRPARIADLGCGTGSLSVLVAQRGHCVTGVDLSPKMIGLARKKALAASVNVDFLIADASEPPLQAHHFDVVLARHVLWALPDPGAGVGRWIELLDAAGQLLLFEERWATGAGLTADETLALIRAHGRDAHATQLPDPIYWGREITDERYVVISPPPTTATA